MLILMRRCMEKVQIWDTVAEREAFLVVLHVDSAGAMDFSAWIAGHWMGARLVTEGNDRRHGDSEFRFSLGEDEVAVRLTKVQGRQAFIGFEAPESVVIQRTELVGRVPTTLGTWA